MIITRSGILLCTNENVTVTAHFMQVINKEKKKSFSDSKVTESKQLYLHYLILGH